MTAFWSQFGPSYWMVRTRVAPHQMASLIAKQLSEASGGLAAGHVLSMDEVMSSSISRQNFNMLLLTVFAASALVLSIVGIYGVVSYSMGQHTREIGVRMALGATRQSILRQFFAETIIVVALSGGTGLIISYGFCALVNLLPMPPFFAGLLASWKLGAVSVALLGLIAVLSALYPANRAASVDPIEALRFEAGG